VVLVPPANGILGASTPLVDDGKLFDGMYGRPDSKPVAILRDAEHRLLGPFVDHPLGQEASLFGSLVPIFDIRCNEHAAGSLRLLKDNRGSDDASGLRAVIHLDPEVRVINTIGPADK
jgi:hypothetical protein